MNLKGKVVVITGASSGIGLAFAKHCVAQEAIVYNLDRQKPKQQIGTYVHTDVTDASSVECAFAGIPRIDVLFNNAGVMVRGKLLDCVVSEFDTMLATTIRGSWLVYKYANLAPDATLLQMSSFHALHYDVEPGPYTFAKICASSLARMLHEQFSSYDVRVIYPGGVDTPLAWYHLDKKQFVAKKRFTPDEFCDVLVTFLEQKLPLLVFDPSTEQYSYADWD